jgi:alanine dehydrogenase
MRIGIPKEIKTEEGRVGLVPAAAASLVQAGHEVYLQTQAGVLSGYPDEEYQQLGVRILSDAEAVYAKADLIIKVKEPQDAELPLLRKDHLLFCYLHLAAEPTLTRALLDIGLTAVAFETVEDAQGRLPLLTPMSEVAGRIAVQSGAVYLHQYNQGRGLLLGGVPAAERGKVVILGAGQAGSSAAELASRMGAEVVVFDTKAEKLDSMYRLGENVTALYPFAESLQQQVLQADLLIGAVLIHGAKTPHLVDTETVKQMKDGSVIIDISVDQGGCIETTKPTTHEAPTFIYEGVVHYGVTNMPGAVPRTSSQALSAAILPYAQILARENWRENPDLVKGINVASGEVCYPALQ